MVTPGHLLDAIAVDGDQRKLPGDIEAGEQDEEQYRSEAECGFYDALA
jgi:hypothetical protein